MELIGTVIQVMDIITGTSSKGEWKKQDFILETDGNYPKQICCTLWGDKVGTVSDMDRVTAHIELSSREYNGRWYTDVKVWKLEGATPSGGSTGRAPEQRVKESQAPAASGGGEQSNSGTTPLEDFPVDDLPF